VGADTDGGGAAGAGLPGVDTSGVLRNEAGQPTSCRVVSTSADTHRQVPDLTRFLGREQAKVLGFIPMSLSKSFAPLLLVPLLLIGTPCLEARTVAADSSIPGGERLGTVDFPVSCSSEIQAQFNRGVALEHDFWYTEAQPQFERIVKADPACAMAHWGIAMSVFHEIWGRPDDATMAFGWREMLAAKKHPAKTERERQYIDALAIFYRPDKREYLARAGDYATAMGALYRQHPEDVDAGSFYALALLASASPRDTSLSANRNAMAVLAPLFQKFPDHPGVVHYIIHACDTPALAPDGLAAARRYGEIASSGPHAVHMPGHIFARLGMWQEDIDANVGSVEASKVAEAHHESGAMDQFHSDDFLLYAYLQAGRDAEAEGILTESAATIDHFEHMPNMAGSYMVNMFPFFRTEYPTIYDLEMRDWHAAAALEPVTGASPETQKQTYWTRAIAHGHLRQTQEARTDLAAYDALVEKIRKGKNAWSVDSAGAQIGRKEMLAWAAFAADDIAQALKEMREAAELQDKAGQGEVDIPAREMLADMLLESGNARDALAEYKLALELSPNRFNGLYSAGLAAEKLGDKGQAASYYAALLKSTDNGAHSTRPELDHVKTFMASAR
jgi:tetratricopeptide (TPR) repeat protein